MTLTTMIILNVVLDLALLGGLAFLMSRAVKLTPHRPGITGNFWRIRRTQRQSSRRVRGERTPTRLSPVLDR